MPIINITVSRPPDAQLVARLSEGVLERTARVLRKNRELTAVAFQFVPAEQWIVGGRSLADQGRHSFWLEIKVVDGTNTKDEKAAYLAEIFAFMEEVLGPLHPESYAHVHEVKADAYGFGGKTQEQRYIQGKLRQVDLAVSPTRDVTEAGA
jgi:4-oxalocrotonate tautomerase